MGLGPILTLVCLLSGFWGPSGILTIALKSLQDGHVSFAAPICKGGGESEPARAFFFAAGQLGTNQGVRE